LPLSQVEKVIPLSMVDVFATLSELATIGHPREVAFRMYHGRRATRGGSG
jgi:hypothetical protein